MTPFLFGIPLEGYFQVFCDKKSPLTFSFWLCNCYWNLTSQMVHFKGEILGISKEKIGGFIHQTWIHVIKENVLHNVLELSITSLIIYLYLPFLLEDFELTLLHSICCRWTSSSPLSPSFWGLEACVAPRSILSLIPLDVGRTFESSVRSLRWESILLIML